MSRRQDGAEGRAAGAAACPKARTDTIQPLQCSPPWCSYQVPGVGTRSSHEKYLPRALVSGLPTLPLAPRPPWPTFVNTEPQLAAEGAGQNNHRWSIAAGGAQEATYACSRGERGQATGPRRHARQPLLLPPSATGATLTQAVFVRLAGRQKVYLAVLAQPAKWAPAEREDRNGHAAAASPRRRRRRSKAIAVRAARRRTCSSHPPRSSCRRAGGQKRELQLGQVRGCSCRDCPALPSTSHPNLVHSASHTGGPGSVRSAAAAAHTAAHKRRADRRLNLARTWFEFIGNEKWRAQAERPAHEGDACAVATHSTSAPPCAGAGLHKRSQ